MLTYLAGRFSAFGPDGKLMRSVPRQVAGVIFPWHGEFDVDGQMIDWGVDFPQMHSSMDLGRLSVYYPVRVDLADGSVDTLPRLEFEAGSDHEFRVPFRRGLVFHLSASHLWMGVSGEYVLVRTTLTGDTTLIISRSGVEPMPVTAAELDSILSAPDPLGEMTGERLSADWIPATKPLLVRMSADGAGHLFVFPRLAGREAGTIVDVFVEETGEYLGQVDLPVRLEMNPRPVAVRGTLVGVMKGEFDVPIVVRIHLGPVQ